MRHVRVAGAYVLFLALLGAVAPFVPDSSNYVTVLVVLSLPVGVVAPLAAFIVGGTLEMIGVSPENDPVGAVFLFLIFSGVGLANVTLMAAFQLLVQSFRGTGRRDE